MMQLLMPRPGDAMRTTLTLDDELIERATQLTGVSSRTEVIRQGLETLIRVEAGRRLAKLGGTDPQASVPPRARNHT